MNPIYPLRRAYDKFYVRTIFTRDASQSRPANAAEIEMLSTRLLAGREAFDIGPSLSPDAIRRSRVTDEPLEHFLDRTFRAYWEEVPIPRPETPLYVEPSQVGPVLHPQMSAGLESLRAGVEAIVSKTDFLGQRPENRTKDEFLNALIVYRETARAAYPRLINRVIGETQPVPKLTITNNTSRFLDKVELKIHLEGPIIAVPLPFPFRFLRSPTLASGRASHGSGVLGVRT